MLFENLYFFFLKKKIGFHFKSINKLNIQRMSKHRHSFAIFLRLFDVCVFCCSLPFRINRLRKCQTQSNRRMWIKPIKNNPKKSVLKPFRNRTPKKCWPCWKNTFSRWAKWEKINAIFKVLAVEFVYFGLFVDFVFTQNATWFNRFELLHFGRHECWQKQMLYVYVWP